MCLLNINMMSSAYTGNVSCWHCCREGWKRQRGWGKSAFDTDGQRLYESVMSKSLDFCNLQV